MPVTPQITLTGTIADIFGVSDAGGQIVVTLQRYGSTVPRVIGTAFVVKAQIDVACPAGTFSFSVWGNDVISPAGTTYVVSFIPDNGGVIQCMEYQFTGSGSQDLSSITPFIVPVGPPAPPAPPNAVLLNPTGTQTIEDFSLILEEALEISGNNGVPNATSAGLWLASGFGATILGRAYIGDGSGKQFNLAKRTASTDTDLFQFFDSGALGLITAGLIEWNGDTGLSRSAAGRVAVGNGTQGNESGTIAATIAALVSAGTLKWTTDTGLSRSAAGRVAVGNGAQGNESGTIAATIAALVSAGILKWSTDTGLSRSAAGRVAVGNGTQGDVSGSVDAAAYLLGGTAMQGASGGVVRAGSPTITAPTISGASLILGQALTGIRVQAFTVSSQAPNATDGQEWTLDLTWSLPFADASYLVFGAITSSSAGSPLFQGANAFTPSTVTIQFVQASAVQSTVTGVVLFAVHL
jgi:hypothetical protein